MKYIRAKAVVIFEHQSKFLFTVCDEESKGIFFIPVGGGVEFGEHSIAAAKREVLEEIGQEIKTEQLLDISENIFTYNGIEEHEIVFLYKAEFKNNQAHLNLVGNLNDKGKQIELTWATIDEIREKEINIYPFNLLEILNKLAGR